LIRRFAQANCDSLFVCLDLYLPSKGESDSPERRRRIYPVSDPAAIADLVRLLPGLVPNWDSKHGSIQQIGESVLIDQEDRVHDRVGQIVGTLNAVYARRHPPSPDKTPIPEANTEAPAGKRGM